MARKATTYEEYREEFRNRPFGGPACYSVYTRLYQMARYNNWPFPPGGMRAGQYTDPAFQLPDSPGGHDRWGVAAKPPRPRAKGDHKTYLWEQRSDEYREQVERCQDVLLEFKERGCVACPEARALCIDCHHLDPTTKGDRSFSSLARSGNMEQLREELAKCVPLCANCHRLLHAGVLELPAP